MADITIKTHGERVEASGDTFTLGSSATQTLPAYEARAEWVVRYNPDIKLGMLLTDHEINSLFVITGVETIGRRRYMKITGTAQVSIATAN